MNRFHGRPAFLAGSLLLSLLLPAVLPLAAAAGEHKDPAGAGGGPRAEKMAAEKMPAEEPLTADQRDYLRELTGRANAMGLWKRRFWQLLLHYREDTLGSGVTSEADDPAFFNAAEGKTDPRAEGNATLAAFFSSRRGGLLKMTPQCIFPARYRWLDSQLGFDSARMPVRPCEQYDRWRKRVNADSVSLIFSSYFFNNPASMFGHTLLVFHQKGELGKTELLDFAVNYAAAVPTDENGFVYAVRGVFGGYRGYFSMLPFYVKIKEYNDIENRDMWEYRLNFSPDRIDYMLRHAWELGSTYFDYYFFKENCSYHLLSLLEIADPELRLTDEYDYWTMPGETIKQVVSIPGLVSEVVYRPSLGSQFQQKLAVMKDDERDWVDALIGDAGRSGEAGFRALPVERQALVMDAAIEYHQYKLADRPEGERERKANLRRLLLARAKNPSVGTVEDLPRLSTPPEGGHDSSRVSIAGGASRAAVPKGEKKNEPFVEFSFQPVFHDLLSRDEGYAPNSQINLAHLRLRYETEAEKLRLERFALIDIVSLFPLSSIVTQPSWKVGVGWQRNRDSGCDPCAPFFLNPGLGFSLQSNLLGREVYFAMVEGSYEYDRKLENGHRAGFGVSGGVMVDLSDAWRVALFASRTRFTEGQRGFVGKAELRQRISLSRNLELTLDWVRVEDYREGKLGLGVYF